MNKKSEMWNYTYTNIAKKIDHRHNEDKMQKYYGSENFKN